ncbi:MAG TPA: hypothetical protein VFG91_12445 [Woeseiaceae bacterium]|nr:hypothetical protein [Woeseiaceae bacterium]
MRKLLSAILAATLITSAASMLMAQETEPGMKRMHRGMQAMKDMDADGNGEISKEEFVKAHEEMFASMDENGDGKLDQEEQRAMMEKMMRHHKMEGMDHHEMEGMDHENMEDMDHHQM